MPTKPQQPAIEGWFTMDAEQPHLLGSKCTSCGTYSFPAASHFCGNPACAGTEFETVELSRTGTVWSFTDNRYQPPEPYISPDPFEPYVIAAVQLAEEGLVILGQQRTAEGKAVQKTGTGGTEVKGHDRPCVQLPGHNAGH